MKEKLSYAIQHWNLSDVEIIYEESERAVYSASSPDFGAVILKLNQNIRQLREEYDMLSVMNSNRLNEEQKNFCCNVWAYNAERGILLEERLLPGTVLREEVSLEKRILAFRQIFLNIHGEVFGDGCQTYLDWLEEICSFCEKQKDNLVLKEKRFGEYNLMAFAEQAKRICQSFFGKYKERVLLHGDLHHDNILLREDGSYAMIDPKGVVGPEILDLPRYMMNEIDTKYTEPAKDHMRKVLRCMSEVFGYPEIEVAQAYFMEVVLGNIWCMEDGEEINEEEIRIAQEILCETEKKML